MWTDTGLIWRSTREWREAAAGRVRRGLLAGAFARLIFADLHFEKGSSYARGRQFLPPYDTARHACCAWREAMARHTPARIIALGDSFHDGGAADRLGAEERGHAASADAGRRISSGSPAITIPIRRPGWAAR